MGEAGTGFSDRELVGIRDRLDKIKTQKVNEKIPDVESWVRPLMVVEVKFHERSKNNKYRHPSFVRLRYDKPPDQVQ